MSKERLEELLDHIGNEVNLLHQAKLKRKVLQAFMDLLEDKQDMLNFFVEYSKKSIEMEKQNKRYREAMKNAVDELESGDFLNAEDIIIDALEAESE